MVCLQTIQVTLWTETSRQKWYNTLCKALASIEFKQSEADPTESYTHEKMLKTLS
jgi:hypothetical protein